MYIYHVMPQSLSHVVIHTIFSTKHRRPFLLDSDLRSDTFAYLGGVCRSFDAIPLIIGGHTDHVHLLTTLPRTLSQSEFVKECKRPSTNWLKKEKGVEDFSWQSGYGVFSVSESRIPLVVHYIQQQEEHHRTKTFQEEYRQFLEKHKISYDERYVWD